MFLFRFPELNPVLLFGLRDLRRSSHSRGRTAGGRGHQGRRDFPRGLGPPFPRPCARANPGAPRPARRRFTRRPGPAGSPVDGWRSRPPDLEAGGPCGSGRRVRRAKPAAPGLWDAHRRRRGLCERAGGSRRVTDNKTIACDPSHRREFLRSTFAVKIISNQKRNVVGLRWK